MQIHIHQLLEMNYLHSSKSSSSNQQFSSCNMIPLYDEIKSKSSWIKSKEMVDSLCLLLFAGYWLTALQSALPLIINACLIH